MSPRPRPPAKDSFMPDLPPPKPDGLLTPEVGDWSRDKHHFLRRYLDAFTTAMKNKGWSGLHYIDLFAGAGVEQLKLSKELQWGSPMLAAQTRFPFTRLHLCEIDKEKHDALAQRIARLALSSDPQVLLGDANDKVHEIIATIPPGALSLAFLDPYGLHLDFGTVRALSAKRTDLIVFFPDYLDVLRNLSTYKATPDSNMDRFMGDGVDWLAVLRETPQDRRAETLRELYVRQIEKLGYKHFEYERIRAHGHPLYLLIFCSKHPLGAKIWRGISSTKPGGQKTIDFDR